jgi:hypothetical protein
MATTAVTVKYSRPDLRNTKIEGLPSECKSLCKINQGRNKETAGGLRDVPGDFTKFRFEVLQHKLFNHLLFWSVGKG